MKISDLRLVVGLVLLLSSMLVSAGTAQILVPNYQINELTDYPIQVGSGMLYLTDPEHELEIQDLLSSPRSWNTINRRSPNFGFTETAYWFRFNLTNSSQQAQQVFIELPIPFLDEVRLYQMQDRAVIHQNIVGDAYPFAERPVNHPNLVMPFSIQPGVNEMIMRVETGGSVEAPLYIWSPESFYVNSNDRQILQGVWVGVIGIMVIYNLFIYFFVRDKSYLYYVLFSLSYLLFQATLRGYSFAYLWPEQLAWNSIAISPFIALSNVGSLMLVIQFLQLKKHSPSSYKVMKLCAVVSLGLFFLSFVAPYSFTIRMNSAITIVTCFLSLGLGILFWQKGDRNARYFTVAWASAVMGIMILAGIKFGVVPENFWTSNADQIGIVSLIILLSIALASRINTETRLRLQAQDSALLNEKIARQSQAELLESKESANEELERKVAERTRNLQEALAELEHANSRLEILSTTDALTTLFNRGHFEKRMNSEFNRAHRHGRDLSIILCDIDHFKKVNDTYGHNAGDECLRKVALVFKNKITRSGDLIARYGGEEFIILLVDTPIEDARFLANSLCDDIRETSVISDQQVISLTASFGVSSLSQHDLDNAEQLIHHADLALYKAKDNGRDQVVQWSPDEDYS